MALSNAIYYCCIRVDTKHKDNTIIGYRSVYIKHLELAVFHWWLFVQGFDMILIFLLDRRSLQLHRRRQQVVFDGPRLRLQVHVLNNFKALQL